MSKRVFLLSVCRLALSAGIVCNFVGAATFAPLPVAAEDGQAKSTKDSKRPHLDLAFCIDTTGSMQAEIDMVKKKTKSLVAQLSTGKPAPIVRVGVVAYRDQNDAYVTKIFPFTDDIDKVVKDISDLKAEGGGDGPEAVDQGLHVAIKDLKWSDDKHAAKILFLIGDAGPHGAKSDLDWRADCKAAIASGIQINTIGCAGLENYSASTGVDVFKQIAHLADGKFESLAYRQEIADSAGNKTTVVNAGGAAYVLRKGSTTGDAWKKEVAEGSMKPMTVTASLGGAYAADAMSVRGAKSLGRAMPSRAGLAGASTGTVSSFASAAAFPMSSPVPTVSSRADNNLDDIMLRDARARVNNVK